MSRPALKAVGSADALWLARAALRPHGGVNSKFSFARLSAYQRVQAGELTVYIDAGPGPDRPHGGHAIADDDEALAHRCLLILETHRRIHFASPIRQRKRRKAATNRS